MAFALDALTPSMPAFDVMDRTLAAHGVALPRGGTEVPLAGIDSSMDPEEVRDAAKMLESYFITLLLERMRAATDTLRDEDEGYFTPGRAEELFTQQLDQAIGDELAEAGRFGLADIIVRQLLPETPAT